MAPRYAIYFAPKPEGPLWSFGSRVLGYDAASGRAMVQPVLRGISSERLAQLTAEPRKYGFHATLKAPFRLAPRWSVEQLEAALADFVVQASAPELEALDLTSLGSFLALTPRGDTRALANYAQSIVEAFETFRAELTEEDRKRRLKTPLTDRQRAYLDKFGYPYVADEFRFHMTLTGSLGSAERDHLEAELGELYRFSVPESGVAVNRLALFEQPSSDQPFRIKAAFQHPGR